jgi:hypothetical protein
LVLLVVTDPPVGVHGIVRAVRAEGQGKRGASRHRWRLRRCGGTALPLGASLLRQRVSSRRDGCRWGRAVLAIIGAWV